MADAQSSVRVIGRARVELSGEGEWTVSSTDASAAQRAVGSAGTVVEVFRVAIAPRPTNDSRTLEIRVDGDPRRLLAVVEVDGERRPAVGSGSDGEAVFSLTVLAPGCTVWLFEFATSASATEWRERFGGAQTRAEPPPVRPGGGIPGFGLDRVVIRTPFPQPPRLPPRVPRFPLPGLPRPVPAPPPDEIVREADSVPPEPHEPAEAGSEPEEATAAPVPAFVTGEMPGTARQHDVITVEATLSWERRTPSDDTEFEDALVKIRPDLPVSVSISTHGYRLAHGSRTRSLRLLAGQPPVSASFALEAVDPGRAEVTLVFRQDDEYPLAELRLVSEITQEPGSQAPVTARGRVIEPDPEMASLPTIRIDETVVAGKSYLDVGVQIGRVRAHGLVQTIDKSQLVERAYDRIAALRQQRTAQKEGDGEVDREGRRSHALKELRAVGVDLSLTLLTPALRSFLWKHVAELDKLVIQTTGEFDIPWELLYVFDPRKDVDDEGEVDTDHFLGMRGSTRWVYNTARPQHIGVARERAMYLCPSYTGPGMALAFSRDEAGLLRRRIHARVVTPGTSKTLSKIVKNGFDLLHFAGHGVWSASPPSQRILLAGYRRDRPDSAATAYSADDLRLDLPDRVMVEEPTKALMVFLNACDLGRLDTSAVGLGGFPEAFLRGGVAVLVGCSWAVDDEIAGDFSRLFYEALGTSDIGDAMRVARTRALENDDLSALAYVAYAHPRTTVSFT